MVDVVFLLIIFFLTTSSLVELTRANVDLPEETGEKENITESPGLIINVTANGRLIVDGEEIPFQRGLAMVAGEVDKAGGSAAVDVLIRADRDAPLRVINDLAEGLMDLDVRGWRLGTQIPFGHAAGDVQGSGGSP